MDSISENKHNENNDKIKAKSIIDIYIIVRNKQVIVLTSKGLIAVIATVNKVTGENITIISKYSFTAKSY